MPLLITRGELKNVPAGMKRLSAEDFLEAQWKDINNWSPKREVWPFRWGISLLFSATALTGLYFNSRFRRKLKLLTVGEKSSYLAVSAIPTIVNMVTHTQFITNTILLGESKCSACLEAKAALLQLGTGVLYPILLAPGINFLYSYRTVSVPFLPHGHEVKKIIQMWYSFTKPLYKPMITLGILNVLFAFYITREEQKCFNFIHESYNLLEEQEFDTK